MIRLIGFFIVLIFAIFIGLQLSIEPGYVLIAYNHWTIETSLWIALATLLLFIFCIHGLWLLMKKIENITDYWKNYQNRDRLSQFKIPIINKKNTLMLQQDLYLSSIQELIEKKQDQALDIFMSNLPRKFRYNSVLITEYVQFLLDNNQHVKAETILRKHLKKLPEPNLIELYGLCLSNEKQLNFAERLLKSLPPSATLYLCLGRICIHHKLWGKAKNYLEQSIALEATASAYKELGMLYDALHEPESANKNYKLGLDLIKDNNL